MVSVEIPHTSQLIGYKSQPLVDAFSRLWDDVNVQTDYYNLVQATMPGTPFADDSMEIYYFNSSFLPDDHKLLVDCASVFDSSSRQRERRDLGFFKNLWDSFISGCFELFPGAGPLKTGSDLIEEAGVETMIAGISAMTEFKLQGNCLKRLEHVSEHYFLDSSCQTSYLPSSFNGNDFRLMCSFNKNCAKPGHPPKPQQEYFYSDESGSCVQHYWVDQEGFEGDYNDLDWCLLVAVEYL